MVWNIKDSMNKECPFCHKLNKEHTVKSHISHGITFAIMLCPSVPPNELVIVNNIPYCREE